MEYSKDLNFKTKEDLSHSRYGKGDGKLLDKMRNEKEWR